MDLHDSLRVCRKHARMILSVFLAAVFVAGYYAYTTPKIYRSQIRLFVTSQSGTLTSEGDFLLDDAYSRSQLSIERVQSYALVISGSRVASEVAQRLQFKDKNGGLIYPQITANAPADTVLVDVAVIDTDPRRAQATATMTGKVVVELVEQLERPTGTERSSLRIAVVENANLPTAPVAPRKKLILLMGAFFGLAAGVAISMLRDKLDTSIKNPEDIAAATHAPVLGVIAYDSRTPKRPLVVQVDPRSPMAESYRQLRTNIRFVNIDSTLRSFVVTSAVSTEGKSTISCNLAIAMAQAGQRVILVEADLRKPSVRQYMGIEGSVGLTNVLLGEVELDDVLQPWGGGLLSVLPGGTIAPNPSELLGSAGMAEVIRRLEAQSDLVIFDAPPLLPVTDAAVLGVNTDGAVLVVRSGSTGRDRMDRAVESLAGVGVHIVGAVLNMAPTKGPDSDHYYSYYGKDRPADGLRGVFERKRVRRRGEMAAAAARKRKTAAPSTAGSLVEREEPLRRTASR